MFVEALFAQIREYALFYALFLFDRAECLESSVTLRPCEEHCDHIAYVEHAKL